ncbi:hypothetical protein PPTG_03829 [Phytophthora nicotianae INRA-310]|uniref:Uncharacterized protein n=1 Tax=Phytophthora nicotianae (strain INRA-310) TaxID=761204 RepID=W2R076_PHYN3|nr:hypothetical protein PPTG_03829 [Phytophthora nicotianae INRA-310]ETN18134.1 hypothetical protein PPTG_03829 [Phytophthora nicotianae INRA-310]
MTDQTCNLRTNSGPCGEQEPRPRCWLAEVQQLNERLRRLRPRRTAPRAQERLRRPLRRLPGLLQR